MSIKFEQASVTPGLPTIKVIGVGGCGGNVINRMVEEHIQSVEYIASNTDAVALKSSLASKLLPLGGEITKGMGSGMKPDIAQKAAEDSIDEIDEILENADMVFITAGMGGGTGTGASPVFAERAKEKGILTVGVVTTPFRFEGPKRKKYALEGIDNLRKHVDTLMVIDNNKLVQLSDRKTSIKQAFEPADEVLKQAIGSITNLINLEGFINLDFADLRTVIAGKGRAIIGTGEASGENRGIEASKKAIQSPLLNNTAISGATGIIINIIADPRFSLAEAEEAAMFIQETADKDAHVIFGLVIDEEKDDEISITVIAAGFGEQKSEVSHIPLRVHDSIKNTKKHIIEKLDAANTNQEQEKIVELDSEQVVLNVVENKLHYPEGSNVSGESLDDYDIPSFVRNQQK